MQFAVQSQSLAYCCCKVVTVTDQPSGTTVFAITDLTQSTKTVGGLLVET